MPIDPTSITHCEIVILGTAATGGSSVTPSINVFNYRRTTTVNPLSKANISAIFQASVSANLLAAANVRYTPSNIAIRFTDDALDAPVNFDCPGVGAIATDSLPSDDAVCMILQTGLRGPSYRGSKHFGPASEIDTTNDILTGAGLARWQTLRAAVAANLVDASGNTWVPQVLSRKLSRLRVNPTLVIANDVVKVLLDLNIGTMRRRRSRTIRP